MCVWGGGQAVHPLFPSSLYTHSLSLPLAPSLSLYSLVLSRPPRLFSLLFLPPLFPPWLTLSASLLPVSVLSPPLPLSSSLSPSPPLAADTHGHVHARTNTTPPLPPSQGHRLCGQQHVGAPQRGGQGGLQAQGRPTQCSGGAARGAGKVCGVAMLWRGWAEEGVSVARRSRAAQRGRWGESGGAGLLVVGWVS